MTYGELLTNLIEIEGIVNSRPLTYDYDETNGEVLTPSHLIFGYRLDSLSDDVICTMDKDIDEAKNLRKPYRFMIYLRNHFWN